MSAYKLRVGSKFLCRTGEVLHLIAIDTDVHFRVNGTSFCLTGCAGNVQGLLKGLAATRLTPGQYKKRLDKFWSKRTDEKTERVE